MSRSILLLALLLLTFSGARASTPPPKPDHPVLILRTSAGDIAAELLPELAPRHVAQILTLARKGIYDGFRFHRVDPGFVAQVSTQYDRLTPLTRDQSAVIHPLEAEFSTAIHHRGTLSMARGEDPNSAEVSFSILLGDAPHLDGQYTIFGRVIRGMDTVDAIEKTQVTRQFAPFKRITVYRAETTTLRELPRFALRPAVPIPVVSNEVSSTMMLLVLIAQGLLGFAVSWAARRGANGIARSLGLAMVLVTTFGICILLLPHIRLGSPAAGIGMFIAILITIRLMTRFEESARPANVVPLSRKKAS